MYRVVHNNNILYATDSVYYANYYCDAYNMGSPQDKAQVECYCDFIDVRGYPFFKVYLYDDFVLKIEEVRLDNTSNEEYLKYLCHNNKSEHCEVYDMYIVYCRTEDEAIDKAKELHKQWKRWLKKGLNK